MPLSDTLDVLQVSVVVCTRDRVHSLRRCLASLALQEAPPVSFEVIVVDNGSSDETPRVIRDMVERHANFRSCLETNLGLSYARNRGAREALGRYVAFIDDDAEAYSDWIEEMLSFIRRKGDISAFGGPYDAMVDTPVPSWFPPEYGSFQLGDRETVLDCTTRFLCGTNMIFRRDLLLEIGGFRVGLGMSGKKISYGEETRLQIDLKRQGHEIWYLPSLKVKHLVAPQKMKLRWLLKSVYAVGRCSSATLAVRRTLPSCCAGICYGVVYALRRFITSGSIPLRRKLYYALIPFISEIGALHEYLETFKSSPRSEADGKNS